MSEVGSFGPMGLPGSLSHWQSHPACPFERWVIAGEIKKPAAHAIQWSRKSGLNSGV